MKIILSRKGCDSDFGGIPGIILPNNQILYIPIPGDDEECIKYSDINIADRGEKLADIMKAVTPHIRLNGQKIMITDETKCHLDPDLDYYAYPRLDAWKGCFGQADAAQTVLQKKGVSEGDIFLFFGWFNRTYMENGTLRFCQGQGIHLIFGWMQIDDVIYTHKEQLPEWLEYHPHAIKRRLDKQSNCIYVGKETLSWNKKICGYGIFPKVSPELILTKDGLSRSRWQLPKEFQGIPITYHSDNSWKEDYFQSACRGQEFVFEESDIVEKWAKTIIENNQ